MSAFHHAMGTQCPAHPPSFPKSRWKQEMQSQPLTLWNDGVQEEDPQVTVRTWDHSQPVTQLSNAQTLLYNPHHGFCFPKAVSDPEQGFFIPLTDASQSHEGRARLNCPSSAAVQVILMDLSSITIPWVGNVPSTSIPIHPSTSTQFHHHVPTEGLMLHNSSVFISPRNCHCCCSFGLSD